MSSTVQRTQIVRQFKAGQWHEVEIPRQPDIHEIRENLSYRGGEDKSFRWRGEILAYGHWDAEEKVYSVRNPLFSGMLFPSWEKAFEYIDSEKHAIMDELLKLQPAEEDE